MADFDLEKEWAKRFEGEPVPMKIPLWDPKPKTPGQWKPLAEAYDWEDGEDGGFCTLSNYWPMLKSFGYEILAQGEQDGYEGDSYVLYRNGSDFGFLVFGWGSCSGCDALQGCGSEEELESLRQSLHDKIKWRHSAQAMADWMSAKDWEGEHFGEEEEFKEFLEVALGTLRKTAAMEK